MESSDASPRETAIEDRWRTHLLAAAIGPLLLVAMLMAYDLWRELRDYFANAELRAISAPFWLLQLPVVVTLAHVLIAVGTLRAFRHRRDPNRSRRILLFAFGLSIPMQVLPRLVPLAWHFDIDADAADQFAATLAQWAPLSALGGATDLLPILVSVTVGLSRAGLRRVRIAPDDPGGATTAFIASMQLGLVSAIGLALVEPLFPGHWIVYGVALITLHYAGAAVLCFLLTKRRSSAARKWLRRGLLASACLVLLPGLVEMLIGLWGLEVLDTHLVSWGERDGMLTPSQAAIQVAAFAGRALITAVAANDLLARARASA